MDQTDKKLLQLLQKDATLTHKQLAGLLNLSTTPIHERIKRLERSGVIAGYVALLDAEQLNKTLMAYTNVTLKEHTKSYLLKFQDEISKISEVVECYHIAGIYDYLLKILVKDMNEYQSVVVNKLAAMENIQNVQSSFVMTKVMHSTRIPIT
ncbi:MAG: Lrp/AsnC family leucine-responsive transcriptional regulator [Cyclobacteriaceae bacterium]|jgi:Lrp/AsnC family leucine-responsive transcriptional regulator